jgi:DNA-binding NarL/FixJ family response regulator
MASEMGVTINTLRGYVQSVLTKLGVHSRLEAAATAREGQHRSVV